MGDNFRRNIECEMDRFEAEISSLSRPMGGGAPAFIPAQLRRHPHPPQAGVIAAAPLLNRPPQQVTISGAPQVYQAPGVRQRLPISQAPGGLPRGVRPMLRAPTDGVITGQPTFLRPATATSGQPPQGGFIPIGGPGVVHVSTPIVGAPMLTTPVETLPPPSQHSEPKPSSSHSSSAADHDDSDKKNKNKNKKNKMPKKLIRSAGGTHWEDHSLQDWDPSDFRLFCGDLGNDVTDEVLTRVFGRYPSFQKARVIRDKRTNKTKGYGFVSFKDPNDFVRAVKELDGRYVGSRPIKLRKSNWKNRNVDVVRKRENERKALLGIKKPKF